MLHYADVPRVTESSFRLKVFGAVESPGEWSWDEFRVLPRVTLASDFHCVTTWSKFDNTWEGVAFKTVVDRVKPRGQFAMMHSSDGYYTNLPLSWLLDEDVLFAWSHDGKPLTPEHGGPLRLVVPKLYAWKSAKWINGVEFMDQDRRGFWEERGYHNLVGFARLQVRGVGGEDLLDQLGRADEHHGVGLEALPVQREQIAVAARTPFHQLDGAQRPQQHLCDSGKARSGGQAHAGSLTPSPVVIT